MKGMWKVEVLETQPHAWRTISWHVELEAALVIFRAEKKHFERVRLTSPQS